MRAHPASPGDKVAWFSQGATSLLPAPLAALAHTVAATCNEHIGRALSARCGGAAGNVHAQVGFDFGAESAFAKATVDTDISDKAAVASATWFQRGARAWEGSRVAGMGASSTASTGLTWRAVLSSLGRGRWELDAACW